MAGTVRVLGIDPAAGGPALRARVGLMLQDGGIDPRAQPRETLRQYGRFHADPRDADELLDLVGLSAVARTRYRRLSGGERQRLGLALALVGRPEVVILDEPTAGMDPEARATTRAIVADLRDERRGGPADEPRPDRRRAAGRPDLRPRRRPDRRVRDARRAARRGDATAPVPARPGAGRRRVGGAGRGAGGGPGRAHGSCPMAMAPATDSTARSPDAALVAAIAGVVRDRRSAHRRAADRGRQPRGRLPRAGRRGSADEAARATTPDGRTTREPARIARRGDHGPDRDGAAADRAAWRERPGHDRHPGRRPALLRLGQRPADRERPPGRLPAARGRSRWRSSRPAWSTSASRPPTSATTASSSGSAARR